MLFPRCTPSPVSCVASLHPGVRYPGRGNAGFGMELGCRPHSPGCSRPATPLALTPSLGCWSSPCSAAAAKTTACLRGAGGRCGGCFGGGCCDGGYRGRLRQTVGWCRMGCGWRWRQRQRQRQKQVPGTESAPWSPSGPPAPGSPQCHGPRGSSLLPW